MKISGFQLDERSTEKGDRKEDGDSQRPKVDDVDT